MFYLDKFKFACYVTLFMCVLLILTACAKVVTSFRTELLTSQMLASYQPSFYGSSSRRLPQLMQTLNFKVTEKFLVRIGPAECGSCGYYPIFILRRATRLRFFNSSVLNIFSYVALKFAKTKLISHIYLIACYGLQRFDVVKW